MTSNFEQLLSQHVTEEMERYGEILDLLDQNHNASKAAHARTEARVVELIKSIAALAESEKKYHDSPCPQLLSAVPDGDLAGHRSAHSSLIKAAKETSELLAHIKKTVVTAAIISVGGWLLLSAWAQFLRGPVGP